MKPLHKNKILRLGIVLLLTVSGISSLEIPDAETDEVEAAQTNPQTNKQDTNETKSISNTTVFWRLYTITTIGYAPLNNPSPVLTQAGIFRERTAVQELNGELTWTPSNKFLIKTDAQAQYSTSYETDTPLADKGAQDWLKINEAFFEIRPTSNFSFLAGKYRRVFSPGIFQNPMDRHNPTVSLPGQPAQREGAYTAQANFRVGPDRGSVSDILITAAWLPAPLLDKYGLPNSSIDVIRVNELKYQLVRDHLSYDSEMQGGFIRLYGNLFQSDVNIVSYYLEQQIQVGASLSRYIYNWLELHGETLLYEKKHYPMLSSGSKKGSLLNDSLVGARLEYDNDVGIILEWIHREDQPQFVPVSPVERLAMLAGLLNPYAMRNLTTPMKDYSASSFYIRNISDKYGLTLNFIYGIQRPEGSISLRGDADIGTHGRISLIGSYIAGASDTFSSVIIPNEYRLATELNLTF